jgi:protein-disulfide isomerase
LEGALQQFEGEVQLVLYSYALNSRSEVAAQAALCAGEQGKFWEFHRMLYRRQAQWSHLANPLSQLLEFTNGMELDRAALKSCVQSGRMLKLIRADQDYGRSLQVHSTPTLFVNNQRIIGTQPEADLVRTIRQELARARRPSS